MTIFCSADEFNSLCKDAAGKAQRMCLQAKGGSMHPFIRSGDWVDVALCRGNARDIRKGDIILFMKEDCFYLHRVLRISGNGFLVKGDMSFGHDGVIPAGDILARVITIRRGGQSFDLLSPANRLISVLVSDSSLFLQYPVLFSRKMIALCMPVLSRIQGSKAYRRIAKKFIKGSVTVRVAGLEDEEQLRDLYLMSGRDIRDGLVQIKNEGFWLIAEFKGRIVAGLTMTRHENDPALWVIFGLEVKPLFRGMGIGRKIVQAAILKAKGSGAYRIGLFVNKKAKPALSLYSSLGFKAEDNVPAESNRSSDELYLSYEADDGSDWSLVLDKAVEEGVFYPLYKNLLLSDQKDRVIPQTVREKYRQMYYLHLSKSGDFNSRVERILDFLESSRIRVLLFKGPAVDSFIYDDFTRPRLDLDIAVRDEDMAVLENALLSLGYVQSAYERDCPIPEYLNSRLFIPQADDLIPLHVHKHLINNMFLTVDNALSIDMEKVWEETVQFKSYRYICMLKPELNIIYLCEHALKHDFDQMIFLYEIERLISCYKWVLDWEKLVCLARGLGLGRPAYYGFYFVQKLLSRADIPAEVLHHLKPERLSALEKVFVKNTLDRNHRRYASYPVYLAMREGLFKKANFIFRTIFPPAFTPKGYAMRIGKLILPQRPVFARFAKAECE